MKITTILFDLDGTLLPMEQEVFEKGYFGMLAKKLAPLGYEPKSLVDGIWSGTAAMVMNDGSKTNEKAFWARFAEIFGEKVYGQQDIFDSFYHEEFQETKQFCGYNPMAKEVVEFVKEKGYRVVCATNPLFPAIATETRMRFAGLHKDMFEYYTTYENSSFCKPNPAYYQEVLARIGCEPQECLMVGNDVTEDMIAAKLGLNVFLVTDCLINKKQEDISNYPHGDFSELMKYIENMN